MVWQSAARSGIDGEGTRSAARREVALDPRDRLQKVESSSMNRAVRVFGVGVLAHPERGAFAGYGVWKNPREMVWLPLSSSTNTSIS